MLNPQQNLGKTREELAQILREFTQLQKRIEAVRDSVADALVRLFGEERPALAGLQEEAFIERIAARVVAQLGSTPNRQAKGEQRYIREKEAAAFLGVSVSALKSWRGKRRHSGPPVTRMGRMVVYSVKELVRFADERTVEKWKPTRHGRERNE